MFVKSILWVLLALGVCLESAHAEQEPLVVALLQLAPEKDDLEANAALAEQACRKAAGQGADIALLPEMWSIGYTRFNPDLPGDKERFYTLARTTDSPYVQRFAKLAKELEIAIAFTYLQAYDPLPRNAVTLFDRHGAEVFTYAKVHTSDFKSMERSMTPGDGFFVAPLDTAKGVVQVGAMICFDREQPESARILMLKGAELVLTPNACNLDELRLDQFKVRAWENAMGVAMANYASPMLNGRSVAYAPSGEELVLARGRAGIYRASFDLEDLRERRGRVIWGNAYRRPHRYGPLTGAQRDPVWNRTDGIGEPYDPASR
ncbi:MAG: carbon-nitrogen hydrolase family protein [Candidatus Hydrogenedens sp.]|nr:carbon-nitrogen hydrolase family protein [Candidatus Hydrogenedens sp.]